MQTLATKDKVLITEGSFGDFKKLKRYHYRYSRPGPFSKIFSARLNNTLAGVIVYSMPNPSVALRNVATNNYFMGHDRRTLISLVNKTIRTISRVIVEPQFRGMGLATTLVRDTMPLLNIPIIEALAVMGYVNPFFEKAGMKAYTAPLDANCVRMAEALSLVGIENDMLVDTEAAQAQIESLSQGKKLFLERETNRFLQGYGNRKLMPQGLARTGFILSKLSNRPVYYIWRNEKVKTQNAKP
ncbi:MAG: GNAT family N-acetyltransferase [Sedimentisphaerales bacterium]|nr:GNAT family N-acetyltransferase [Sedimentisphaerales bacterium]